MAIIIKVKEDKPIYNKIVLAPDEEEKALKIHKCLRILIPKIEKEFEKNVYANGKSKKRKKRIDSRLVYKLGEKLEKTIIDELRVPEDEMPWVFKAIREMYSKSNAFLSRGRRRDDYRYIFEAARLPYLFFIKVTWDGWRRLMDSPTVRSEKRFMDWLKGKYGKTKEIRRGFIRKFLKRLNALLKNKDTSVYTDNELFEKYEKAWSLALADQN